MSARRSARISKIPRISYHEAQADTSHLASDAEEDEDSYVNSSSPSQAKKRKRAAPVSTQKKQKNTKADIFRWADLPGEIKNTIYDFALVEQKPIRIEAAKGPKRLRHYIRRFRASDNPCSSYRKRQLPEPLALGLLRVDRKTHAEAAPIFYSENHFHFESWRAMFFFLRPLDPRTKSWIRSMGVGTYTYCAAGEWVFPAFDALIGVTNLEMLDVASAFRHARELYMHCYHWIDAVGKQKANNYAALEILHGLETYYVIKLGELIAEDMD